MRKTQITYLFGAGASANSIPTVDSLGYRIQDLIKYLTNLPDKCKAANGEANSNKISINIEALKFIIDDLNWLHKEAENHQTVDTLAKKYYVQGNTFLLNRLKRSLISYFYFEQNVKFQTYEKNKNDFPIFLDKRYDNLIASIADRTESGIKLRGHIKCITWNYDLQIDFAIKNYFDNVHYTLKKIKNDLNIHPNHYSYELVAGELFDLNSFATIKLNGNAFIDQDFSNKANENYTISDFRFRLNDASQEEIVKEYIDLFSKLFPDGKIINQGYFKYFNFAWEDEIKYTGHKNVQKEAVKIIANTKVLIIVGYSFPFFNFEIDKNIFEYLDPEEIIIQDFTPFEIKNRFQALLKNKGIQINDEKFTLLNPDKYFPIHPET